MKKNMMLVMFMLGASLFVFTQGMKRKLEPEEIKPEEIKKMKLELAIMVHKQQNILDRRLFDAVVNNDATSLKKALEEGANVHAKLNGATPLHFAAYQGYDKIAAILLKYGAAVYDIDTGEESEQESLHIAAERGYDKFVEVLLENGANVNARDGYGMTPLHLAALEGHDKVVEVLLKNGADIDAPGEYEMTPLHFAVDRKQDKVIEILLQHRADVNIPSNEYQQSTTPLHDEASRGRDKFIVMLLEHGANVDAKNDHGRTPLDEAGKPAPNKDTFYISALIKLFPAKQQTQVNQLIQEAVQSDNPQAWLLGYFKAAYRLAHFKMIDELYDRMKQNKKLAQAISAFLLGKGASAILSHKALREAIANKALAEKDFALAAKYLAVGYPYDSKLAGGVYDQAKSDTGKAGNMAFIKAYNQRQHEEKMMHAKKYFDIDLRQYTGM